MKRTRYVQLMTLLMLTLVSLTAAAGSLKDVPGYVDLEWIQIPAGAEEVQDIDLGPVLLSIAADSDGQTDEALLKALSMIKSIRVKSWSTEGDDPTARKALEKVAAKLDADDWKRLIYVKDDEETVTVSTRYEGKDMVGMMLVTYEPGDMVTFVNVVGDLDLGTLFSLVRQFDKGSIGNMLEELDDVHRIEIDRDDG